MLPTTLIIVATAIVVAFCCLGACRSDINLILSLTGIYIASSLGPGRCPLGSLLRPEILIPPIFRVGVRGQVGELDPHVRMLRQFGNVIAILLDRALPDPRLAARTALLNAACRTSATRAGYALSSSGASFSGDE